MRQLADYCRRRVVDWRETHGKLGARLGLDLRDQVAEHVVKEMNVIVVEGWGAVDEKTGDALERVGALFARTVLQDLFQLGDKGGGSKHQKNFLETPAFGAKRAI